MKLEKKPAGSQGEHSARQSTGTAISVADVKKLRASYLGQLGTSFADDF